LKTEAGVSPGVTGLEVLISLLAFTLIYGILAVVEVKLFLKAAQAGPAPIEMTKVDSSDDEQPLLVGTVY
ncbi:MAG: cytochrome ubiquinol oxidase subunit I, partial [Actinomycetales bacterium]|nr:cytochrome ubiquinol oxidase subunit I [Actinomycetales bacterium]